MNVVNAFGLWIRLSPVSGKTAFVASGLIFPIAVIISRLMRIDFMH